MPTDVPPERPPGSGGAADAWEHNARIGLVLFAIYLAMYAGFIGLSAFGRSVLARPAFGGVNIAVLYGFGLIVAALVLAMVYMFLCKAEPAVGPELTEEQLAEKASEEEGAA